MECQLLSTPHEKAVPADEAGGTLTVRSGKLVWIGSSGKRGSEQLSIADVESECEI